MLSTVALVILFSLLINWMISLSILNQVSEKKQVRVRAAALLFVSGILCGYVVYLL